MRRLDGITDSRDRTLSNVRQTVKDREAWRAAVCGVPKTEQPNNNQGDPSSQSSALAPL